MSTDDEFAKAMGPVRRWREGNILFAENDFIRGAYMVIDDQAKFEGLFGMGFEGPRQICVEYITAEVGKLWDGVPDTSGQRGQREEK